jgi:Zn-finger nucleic acid-binding protein
MRCPTDGNELKMTERSGIEVDYCPACRGVWLDRGELDKIIERSQVQAAPPPSPSGGGAYPGQPTHQGKPYKKKRGSFLEDLFDF